MANILIVDDLEQNRYLLRSILVASGHDVLEADNGTEALELIRRTRPDLIISDILMPQMDGFALCRACKLDEQLRDIPFVFYTATYTDPRDEALAMQLGAARFIVKPIENEDFIAIVGEVLQAHAFGQLAAIPLPPEDETAFYRLYNETLIRKLEDKMLDLEQLNRRLAESEECFRRLAENAQDLIFRYELIPERRFTYVSPAATAITGFTPEEFYADPDLAFNIVHLDDCSLLDAVPPGEVPSGQPLVMRMVRKDGMGIWLEQRRVPTLNIDGVMVAFESITRDITERKQVEAQKEAAFEALQVSLAEKEVLLREVHHRVKNNLASIIGLIGLQKGRLSDLSVSAEFTELGERIHSIALVHEMLYQSETLRRINLQYYLEVLVVQLHASYCSHATIRESVAATGVEMDLDDAIPCGLIVNELITNAFKYAFPAGQPRPGEQECEIEITATWDGSVYTLMVSDNGVGLPTDFDWMKAQTLGLELVVMLSQGQLNGQIELDRSKGTSFRLRFAPKDLE